MFQAQAERRVRLGLVVGELVRSQNLQAKPDQLQAHIEELSQSYEKPAEVMRWYLSDRQRMAEVGGRGRREQRRQPCAREGEGHAETALRRADGQLSEPACAASPNGQGQRLALPSCRLIIDPDMGSTGKQRASESALETTGLGMVPIVIETSGRGERAYDIYSRLLRASGSSSWLGPRDRPDGQPRRCADALSREREPRQGHPSLHQLAGRAR